MLFISFVLPAYKGVFLKQAIDSILSQTYINFELIIVDDASPDNLFEIVSLYKDDRIRYYKNDTNIGGANLVSQWNHSINFANGDYIVLAADDDLYHPDFLKTCVGLAEKYPLANLIRSRVEQIDTQNNLVGVDALLPEFCSKYEFLYHWVQGVSFTCIGNYMFKGPVLKEKKFVDLPHAFGSDVVSVVMMSEYGCANTKEMLFYFRYSPYHLSSSTQNHHFKEKIRAVTMEFTFLNNLNYEVPVDRYDNFFFVQTTPSILYSKCKYDYYNLVIKHLSFFKVFYIAKCELLSYKDKLILFIRFCLDKILKR
jgi:glycosyltransferase involved in cell wall biosynthesis